MSTEEAGKVATEGLAIATEGADIVVDAVNSGAVTDALEAGAGAAGDVLEAGGDAAADAASAVAGAVGDVINNPETAQLIGAGFGELDKAYSLSVNEAKNGIMIASGLASAGCLALIPMLRVEIFRDFGQIAGVMFGSAYSEAEGFMKTTMSIFGGIFNVMTVNLGAALQTDTAAYIGFMVVFIAGALCIALYIWLLCMSGVHKMAADEVREGNEAIPFADIARDKKKTVFLATTTITLSISAYLPVCQACAQILFCDENSYLIQQINGDCNGDAYNGMSALAGLLIIGFVIPLPIFLAIMIERFKPKGSPRNPDITFDQDGEEVPFDAKVYNELVEHDVNQQMIPFRSLYQGFEKEYAQWKVLMMVYKVLFVLPTIMLSAYGTPVILSIFQLALVGLQFLLVSQMAPYIDPMNDHMDFAGRGTAIIVAIGGITVAAAPDSSATSILGVIVMVANFANGLFMILAMASGVPSVKRMVKNCRGAFTLSDTSRNLEDLEVKVAIRNYDIKKEIKHRVWQTWWNGVLLNKCGDDVPGRLVKLQKDTVDNGIKTIKNHWSGEKIDEVRLNRRLARQNWEGVDLFWDDPAGTRDGHLDSKTCFGKMYVKAYPFHIVMVYDDAEDESFIEDNDHLARFLEKQQDEDVTARRKNRREFRALSAEKCHIEFPFHRTEIDRNVPDGHKTVTDSEGKTHTEQQYSDIEIVIYYTNCQVNVASNNDEKAMSAGMRTTCGYADGHGDAIKPKTGEPYHVENRHCVMPQEHMGIDDSWRRSKKMDEFLSKPAAQAGIEKQVPIFEQTLVDYRQALADKAKADNAILGDGFWYYVYNAPDLSRAALTDYLAHNESNPVLQQLPEVEAPGLDYLYKRLAIVQKDVKSATWFVFWEDFWLCNGEMSLVAPLQEFFDPTQPGALCYHYCEKDKLLAFLNEKGLMRKSAEDSYCYCKKLFVPSDIDYLYMKCAGEALPDTKASIREAEEAQALKQRIEDYKDKVVPE